MKDVNNLVAGIRPRRTGTSLKEVAAFGLTQVHPFRRHGDMFGAAFNYSERNSSVTQSIDLGPDAEVPIHPTYATRAYTTTLLSVSMRIIFPMAEHAPAQGGLVSLVELAPLQAADANRAVWP
jgi:hypothetical protein